LGGWIIFGFWMFLDRGIGIAVLQSQSFLVNLTTREIRTSQESLDKSMLKPSQKFGYSIPWKGVPQ
jgi:hypothetical protein